VFLIFRLGVIIINQRQLECFIALAEELNFRRAAERCLMTQSAISQQLRQTENELQSTLFFRTNRQVRLTPSGEAFLNKAREILERFREAKQLVMQVESGKSGVLHVGTTIPAAYIVLSEIVYRMKEALPDMQLAIHEMDTSIQEEELRKNHIDIGLGHPPFEDKTLAAMNIAKVPFNIVMSKDNPLAEKNELKMKDLEKETFILFPRRLGPLQYDEIISLCLKSGFSPRNITEVSPAQAIIAFAGMNIGIGFIASQAQQFRHPNVVYRPLAGDRPYFALGTIHRRDSVNPAIKVFKNIAKEVGSKTN
jgi:DNA-binding transcriptional LysR family regulator